MKKIILVFTSVLFASVVYSQTDSLRNSINYHDPNKPMNSKDMNNKMN